MKQAMEGDVERGNIPPVVRGGEPNPWKYDGETVTLLANLHDKSTHIKYVLQTGEPEHCVQVFRALIKLSNDLNRPVLFISPASAFSLIPFICGVLFGHQLLLIKPYGERIVQDYGDILNKLIDPSDSARITKIYVSAESSE